MKYPLQSGSHSHLEVQAHPPDITSQQVGNSHPKAFRMFVIFCGFPPFLLCTSATLPRIGISWRKNDDGDRQAETSVSHMVTQNRSSSFQSMNGTFCLCQRVSLGECPGAKQELNRESISTVSNTGKGGIFVESSLFPAGFLLATCEPQRHLLYCKVKHSSDSGMTRLREK